MIFYKTELEDAVLIELEKRHDDRGFFARTFCEEEFAAAGLETRFVQHNTSLGWKAGTIRGMHFQHPPHGEIKVIRAVKGAVRDVIADLRPGSPTFGAWQGFDLTEEDGAMLYVPAGFAHGFQTLRDDSIVAYMVSAPYTPGAEGIVRWNDPGLGIDWPLPVSAISEKDAAAPNIDLASGGPLAGV